MLKIIVILTLYSFFFGQDHSFVISEQLKISELIKIESNISKVKTVSYGQGVGNSIYKNKNEFDITKPKLYIRYKSISKLPLETSYYYSKFDSLIRVSIYKWSYPMSIGNLNDLKSQISKKMKNIKFYSTEYDKIKEFFTAKYGQPSFKDDKLQKSGKDFKTIDSYSRRNKWKTDSISIYLNMHYGALSSIEAYITWDESKFDKQNYLANKVYRIDELDSDPLEVDNISILINKKLFEQYENSVSYKFATISVSKTGNVTKVDFMQNHPKLNKILENKLKLMFFKKGLRFKKEVNYIFSKEIILKSL